MTLRIGRVSYLHAEPFYFAMARLGMALHDMVPSAVTAGLTHGVIDAGPVPLVACERLYDRFEPVAGFCIASIQQAGSCLLYSTMPVSTLSGARIGVTEAAAT